MDDHDEIIFFAKIVVLHSRKKQSRPILEVIFLLFNLCYTFPNLLFSWSKERKKIINIFYEFQEMDV